MNSICVYCGSSPGKNPAYLASAQALAQGMANAGLGLVYGGASIGVMGEIANTVLSLNGSVTGVIPQSLVELEIAHEGLSELIVVDDMHQRKAAMASASDGFIALPGGFGTLEELFEMLTWSQLGIHRKPVGVLNVAGYYDKLLGFLDWQVEQGFAKPVHRALLLESDNVDDLLSKMQNFSAPDLPKL